MSCTEVEDVQNLATSFENLGRPPTTGITKLGRSKSLKNLASCRESVGTFSMGTRRKSRSSISLKTLSSTKAASTGNNKVEGKLVPSYIPQVPMKPSYAPQNPFFSFHDSAEDKSQPEFCSKCSSEHLPRDSCPFIFSDTYLSKVVRSYIPQVPREVVPSLIPSYVPHKSFFSFHDGAKVKSQHEFCSKCSLEHCPLQACPYISCAICFRTHNSWGCPYEDFLPQGADFDRVNCMAVCAFDGGLIDEEKWACTWCHGKIAKLTAKYTAARFKALRDYDLKFPEKWMPCTEAEDVRKLAISFENLGRPLSVGMKKSKSLKNLASCNESSGSFSPGTRRRSRSSSSLRTLPSTGDNTIGNNKVESKLVPSYIPQVPSEVVPSFRPSYAPHNPFFSFHDSAEDKSQLEFCSKCSLEHLPRDSCPCIFSDIYLSKVVPSYVPSEVVPSLRPSYVPDKSFFNFHDGAKDESEPEFCSKCSLEHLPRQACPYISCAICFRTHRNWGCPYENFLPQGADFNRDNCMVVCAFDDAGVFDEEKWACTWCHGKIAKLTAKKCCICLKFADHCSYECPKDVDRAARFKALRDYDLTFPKKWVPCGDYLVEEE
ncbi:sacI homology domain-containing protein / WW domain-containing protein, partial [Striga asiatica]